MVSSSDMNVFLCAIVKGVFFSLKAFPYEPSFAPNMMSTSGRTCGTPSVSLYKKLTASSEGKQAKVRTLPTPYDIPPQVFIKKLAQYVKDNIDHVTPPSWAAYAKTGTFASRQPQNSDWWFTRCASLLRKTYIQGPIGVERLRAQYGGRKDQGTRPEHTGKGAGGNIRKIFQQLESAGLVENVKGQGRMLTSEGRRLLDTLATEMKTELEKKKPALAKY
jgi:small subunit ribosomal protein S19e